ncbi:hypothetical protein Tco_1187990 [Tanacetum coccineum]
MQSRAMKLNSDKLRHDQKYKNMKLSQDMQLIQKLRNDQKRMKKVFEVMSGRNIVTNSRVTPSWREIVSLTFSEAGVLHVNWTSFGHCVSRRVEKGYMKLVPENGPKGTTAWEMSASRRKAHFELWVIRRAAFSDQGQGHKGPSTI